MIRPGNKRAQGRDLGLFGDLGKVLKEKGVVVLDWETIDILRARIKGSARAHRIFERRERNLSVFFALSLFFSFFLGKLSVVKAYDIIISFSLSSLSLLFLSLSISLWRL